MWTAKKKGSCSLNIQNLPTASAKSKDGQVELKMGTCASVARRTPPLPIKRNKKKGGQPGGVKRVVLKNITGTPSAPLGGGGGRERNGQKRNGKTD